jgi:hypothetical protein
MSNLDTPLDPSQFKREGQIKVSNVMKDDFGFEIAVEAVPLPSLGLIYPQDGSLFGKETLDIKPMTAREEDILTSRAYIKNGTVLSKLISSCLVDKSIDPDDLVSGDRNALLVSLRITGYGASYDVEVDCPQCSHKSKQSFDLSQLGIKRLQVEPVSMGQNLFEVQLPVTKKVVKVKFLTGHDEREMMLTNERKKKAGMKTDSAITDRLSRSIVAVDGITDKNKLSFFVNNIPARDSLALRKFLDTHEPGVDMKSWMSCPSCHEQSEVVLPMGASFFWPES